MKAINSATMAFLAMVATAPAFAQDTEVFTRSLCEIDTSPLNVEYLFPDGSRSVTTYNSTKLCTGVASKRNIKYECVEPLPEWKLGNRSAKNFKCTINADQCGLKPKANDPSRPFVTATASQLNVQSGVATLTCFYKP